MENQHQKISGYRDFNQDTVDFINQAKQLEAQVLAFQTLVHERLIAQSKMTSGPRQQLENSQAFRWLAIARTDAETSFMATVRAIAQPQPLVIK